MKRRIKKHIDGQHFVKVYLSDEEGIRLTHFVGIIFEQNDKYLLMCDVEDFNYDGFVVFRKSDISEIKRTENEIFFDTIIEKEGMKSSIIEKASSIAFKLDSFLEMFNRLKEKEQAVIIECLYNEDSLFLVGSLSKVEKKKVFVDYINAKGEYDLKPIVSKIKDITYFKFDSVYANLFLKYSKKIE